MHSMYIDVSPIEGPW